MPLFRIFMVSMSKTVLLTEFEYDFKLIGISTHSKDYRLCWEINKKFGVQLYKEKDVLFSSKKGDTANFSMYFYQNEMEEKDLRLISNKSSGRLLVPESKPSDFFLMFYDYGNFEISEMLREIRKINIILTAFEVEVSTLKSKDNLLF